MGWLLFWTGMMVMTKMAAGDAATDQLVTFMAGNPEPVGVLSTSHGRNIDIISASTTLNRPLLPHKMFLDLTSHFVRERTQERCVHAKGAGAFGYYEVTDDFSDICKAKVFSEVGKKTPCAVRFSLSSPGSWGDDTMRDSRGFALKLYTEEGNLDLLGFSTPMFPIKDPLFLPAVSHILKKNPVTNMRDPNMFWDFIILRPEIMNIMLKVFGDEGVPFGWRYMSGFTIHTFQVVNADGVTSFVRFHYIPEGGARNMRSEDATRIGGEDPDYFIRDLYNAIENGDYPSWYVGVQVLSTDDVKNATFDVFDVSKELPVDKYPVRVIGRFVLNKNPSNVFADVEQLAFGPGNLVPGILGSPDKLFEARILAYKDAQNYRLGPNFNKIKVNKPITTPFTYNRDGAQPLDDNESGIPNYYPNSFNGPQPYMETNEEQLIEIHEEEADNFDQTSEQYDNMTEEKKVRLIENIVANLGLASAGVQERAVELFKKINSDFGNRMSEGLQNMTASNTTLSYI